MSQPAISPTIFREYDIRGLVDVDLTEEAVGLVARALGTLVRRAGGHRVVVGRDCRLSGERLARQVGGGLVSTGATVIDLGVVPTPVTYFAAEVLAADGLCMITGSHNPPEYNGLKVGVGTSTLHSHGIQELRHLCDAGAFATGQGRVEARDMVAAYREAVRERLSLGARKLKVVVDAGNGTGGAVAVPLLRSLGLEVVSIFEEPDGRFPNHHPDPTVEENLAALREKVLETGADLGIAYDGDADRLGAVDERGKVLWGDELMILFSRALLEEHPGATIVGEVKCSMNLYADIARRGRAPHHVEGGPQPHQGEDEGGGRAPRG